MTDKRQIESLWRAILERAVVDYIKGPNKREVFRTKNGSGYATFEEYAAAIRQDAEDWIFATRTPRSDYIALTFQEVCDGLDLDVEWLRNRIAEEKRNGPETVSDGGA